MLRVIGLVVLAIQAPDTTVVLQAGVRSPAFSATGRLAFELNGDLWVGDMPHGVAGLSSLADRELTRVTAGPAWDSDPAWTPDGSALVFPPTVLEVSTFGVSPWVPTALLEYR